MENYPKSFIKFKNQFTMLKEELSRKEETIFENEAHKIDNTLLEGSYNYFVTHYYHDYNNLRKNNDKVNMIRKAILESVYQPMLDGISGVVDNTTYTGEYLLENTQEELLKLYNIDDKDPIELKIPNKGIITEGGLNWGVMTGTGAALAGSGLGVAVAIGGLTALTIEMFLPSRVSAQVDKTIESFFGKIVLAVVNTKSSLAFFNSLNNTNNTILNFDNINASPEVKKIFQKINHTNNLKEVQEGLETLISSCSAQHQDIYKDSSITEEIKNVIKGDFSPRSYNPIRVIYNAIMRDTEENREKKQKLILFRKCLASKLVDLYKLLLIKNLENKRDYDSIIDNISKTRTRPELALKFNNDDMDSAEFQKFQESIKSLIIFRDHLESLANGMKGGLFAVDSESGLFLLNKLQMADQEVKQHIKTHKQSSPTSRHKFIPGTKNIRKSDVLGNM